MFSSVSNKPSKPVLYPNVFDSLAEVKMSSSFIGATKVSIILLYAWFVMIAAINVIMQIVLPESALKSANKSYEEVSIAHSGTAPPNIAAKIVIKELDDLIKVS